MCSTTLPFLTNCLSSNGYPHIHRHCHIPCSNQNRVHWFASLSSCYRNSKWSNSMHRTVWSEDCTTTTMFYTATVAWFWLTNPSDVQHDGDDSSANTHCSICLLFSSQRPAYCFELHETTSLTIRCSGTFGFYVTALPINFTFLFFRFNLCFIFFRPILTFTSRSNCSCPLFNLFGVTHSDFTRTLCKFFCSALLHI